MLHKKHSESTPSIYKAFHVAAGSQTKEASSFGTVQTVACVRDLRLFQVWELDLARSGELQVGVMTF
jgi:hypothetical protein